MDLIKAETRVLREAEIIFHEIEGDTIMLSLEKGEYYALPSIGTRIWQMLEVPHTAVEICEALVNDFDISLEQCVTDVLVLLNQMAEKAIIRQV